VASYSLIITRSAEKGLAAVGSRLDRQRIDHRILRLADDPRPAGCNKLVGSTNTYRIRQGDYRIIYEVEDERLVVLVVEIGHRKDVYRRGRA